MNDVERMRILLLGKPMTMTTAFNNVVRSFEAKIADEKKRADDAEESLRRVRAELPQQEPRKFNTAIGSKG